MDLNILSLHSLPIYWWLICHSSKSRKDTYCWKGRKGSKIILLITGFRHVGCLSELRNVLTNGQRLTKSISLWFIATNAASKYEKEGWSLTLSVFYFLKFCGVKTMDPIWLVAWDADISIKTVLVLQYLNMESTNINKNMKTTFL